MRQPGEDSYVLVLVADLIPLIIIDNAIITLVRRVDVQAIRLARQ